MVPLVLPIVLLLDLEVDGLHPGCEHARVSALDGNGDLVQAVEDDQSVVLPRPWYLVVTRPGDRLDLPQPLPGESSDEGLEGDRDKTDPGPGTVTIAGS